MTTPGYPQGRALLIGVSEYQRISSLPDAILNDVKDIAATLSSPTYCGYAQENVVSLLNADATRNAVLEGLSDLAAQAGEDDTVCVYFSGHGTVFTGLGGDDSALLTVDSDLSDVAGTAISSSDLATALGQIKAERILVFIDSCHAGGTSIAKGLTYGQEHEFKSGYSETAFVKLAVGRGRALMASCRANEESGVIQGARNSVFTTALLAGLRGAAECLRLFQVPVRSDRPSAPGGCVRTDRGLPLLQRLRPARIAQGAHGVGGLPSLQPVSQRG